MKLVPAQSGICGIEVIQWAKFFEFFSIEEELLCEAQSCSGSVVLGGYVFCISTNNL